MLKEQKMINDAWQFKMLDDRLLVQPLPLRTYEETDTVLDDEANKGKNPMLEELQTKQKVVTINYMYQEAVVLNVSENIKDIQIGDHVIYKVSNLTNFDMVEGVSMLRRYEVIAIKKL